MPPYTIIPTVIGKAISKRKVIMFALTIRASQKLHGFEGPFVASGAHEAPSQILIAEAEENEKRKIKRESKAIILIDGLFTKFF